MTNRIKSVGPIEEEDIERRGVTFEDFSETSEKKGGSGRGTALAKAILLRLEKVVTGIGEALLNHSCVELVNGIGERDGSVTGRRSTRLIRNLCIS